MIDSLLTIPVDAIVFDCDSTLTYLEGIDELACNSVHEEEVKAMTEKAMSETGLTLDLYKRRLDLIKPSQQQVTALGLAYYQQRVPDVVETLSLLTALSKKIFILSAGLKPSLETFAHALGIKDAPIYGVDIYFDAAGNYQGFEEDSILIRNDGKREIIAQLMKTYPRIIHVGDGLNDVASRDLVTRFIGYGGVCYREKVAVVCDYYLTHPSLLSLLPLCLTAEEIATLSEAQLELLQQGVEQL